MLYKVVYKNIAWEMIAFIEEDTESNAIKEFNKFNNYDEYTKIISIEVIERNNQK